MGIDLSSRVSDEDIKAVKNGDSGNKLSDDDIDNFFDDPEDLFSDFDFEPSDGTNKDNNSNGEVQWVNSNNQNTNNNNYNTANKSKTDEAFDRAITETVEVSKNIISILSQLISSLKNRTIDDFGYLASVEIKIGSLLGIIGFGIFFILLICRIDSFRMTAINTGVCGMMLLAIGIAGLFISAYLSSNGIEIGNRVDEVVDLSNQSKADISDFSDAWGDMFDDEDEDFDMDDADDIWDSYDNSSITKETEDEIKEDIMSMFEAEDNNNYEIDSENVLNNIHENAVLNRKYLVDTFKTMLPLSSPKFYERREIYSGTDEYTNIEAICLKAISNIANCEIADIDSRADKMYETDFSYEIHMRRVKRIKNVSALESEIEAYFREDSTDYSVNATVSIEGDFYKIIVSKGNTEIVTIGDVLNCQEYYDEFVNEKNRLPIIYGINELGKINVGDGKLCDSILIAGKQRSGKSWYLLSMLMCLMMFNPPEYIQLIIIDPKDTALFKVVSWMPHVAGIHTAKNILNVLDDVIDNEGAYRKKLLKDNMCDTIWELWDKGIHLPIIYICIDEYISALNSLGDRAKELNEKLLVIKTQFPSQGIRVIFIPHRATGVVDKTNRATTSLKVAVKTELDDTIDTIGEKWDRPLINPGDMALRAPSMMKAEFMRGVSLSRSDEENRKIIETAAKAYYKMGVDIPDMSRMAIACNRNSEAIRAELTGESIREQYNANSIFSILDED